MIEQQKIMQTKELITLRKHKRNLKLTRAWHAVSIILFTCSWRSVAFVVYPRLSHSRGLSNDPTQQHSPLNSATFHSKLPFVSYLDDNTVTDVKVALFSSTKQAAESEAPPNGLPPIQEMKPRDMRKELESYGISTKSFLEKKELVAALTKARQEGMVPVVDEVKAEQAPQTTPSSTTTKASDTDSSSGKSRDERLQEEIVRCQNMKIPELKAELKKLGIPTKTYFEKSEFVRALAEARVDGISNKAGQTTLADEEVFDPSYRDVVMQKLTSDPRLLGGSVIDIRI